MAITDLEAQVIAAAQGEADRRGVDVSVVVAEAIQRFATRADLGRRLAEFDAQDRTRPDRLSEDEAMAIANEELAAMRAERSSSAA
jgi:hypothetical protein